MSSQKLALTAIFMFLLGGCSILDPYIDRRRNPGVQDVAKLYSGPSKPEAPVVCFNPLWSDETEVQKLASDECVKHKTGNFAELVKKTHFDGKLLLPSHAYYKCVMLKKD